jgi:cbb3-type cytochrome c oxidase subunit III
MRKLSLLLTACILISGCNREKSVWDGIYSSAQAGRGSEIYNNHCVSCHTAGLIAGLSGQVFMDDWREDNLKSLFDQMKRTMPADEPSTLRDQEYLDVLAFVLKKNGFPEGRKELAAESLGTIQIIGRNGHGPLPNGALVQTVGCLKKEAPGSWKLARAARLVRSRTLRNLPLSELKSFQQQPLGKDDLVLSTNRFRRFPSLDSDLSPFTDRKVLVEGRLVRKDSDVHIEIFRAQEIDGSCKR